MNSLTAALLGCVYSCSFRYRNLEAVSFSRAWSASVLWMLLIAAVGEVEVAGTLLWLSLDRRSRILSTSSPSPFLFFRGGGAGASLLLSPFPEFSFSSSSLILTLESLTLSTSVSIRCLFFPFLFFPGRPINRRNASCDENFSPTFNKYPGSLMDESDKLLPIFLPAFDMRTAVDFIFPAILFFFFEPFFSIGPFIPSLSSPLFSSSSSSKSFLVADGELISLSNPFSTDNAIRFVIVEILGGLVRFCFSLELFTSFESDSMFSLDFLDFFFLPLLTVTMSSSPCRGLLGWD